MFFSMLHNPTPCDVLSELFGADARISLSMSWMGSGVSKGDVVILDGVPCSVLACVLVANNYHIVATVYEFVGQVTGTASRWRASTEAWQVLQLAEATFRYAVTWYEERGAIVVLTL